MFLLPREVPRSTHLVFYRVGSNSLRFRLRCVAPLSPLCQRPLTSSTRFLLLLLLPTFLPPPPPAPSIDRTTLLVPPNLPLLSFLADRSLLWRLSAVSPLVHLANAALPRGYLVAWLLGYSVTKVPRKKNAGSSVDFCEAKLSAPCLSLSLSLSLSICPSSLSRSLLSYPLCFVQLRSKKRSLTLRRLRFVLQSRCLYHRRVNSVRKRYSNEIFLVLSVD